MSGDPSYPIEQPRRALESGFIDQKIANTADMPASVFSVTDSAATARRVARVPPSLGAG